MIATLTIKKGVVIMSTSAKSRIETRPIFVIYCNDCKKRIIAEEVYEEPNSNRIMQSPVLKCPINHSHQVRTAFEAICLNCERPFLIFSEEEAKKATLCPECAADVLDSLKFKFGEDPIVCSKKDHCHDLTRRNCLGFANLCSC